MERFREEYQQFVNSTGGGEKSSIEKDMINRHRLFTEDGRNTGKYDELCKLMTELRITDDDGTVFVVD